MRHIALLLFSLAVLPLWAQEAPQTILRHDNYLVFVGNAGETVKIAATSIPRGAYQDDLQVKIIDRDSRVVLEQSVPVGTSAEIAYQVKTPGLHVVGTVTGQSLATVRVVGKPFGLVAWEKTTLWICGGMAPQYFMVPAKSKKVEVYVTSDVTTEGATVKIVQPDGKVALEKTDDFDTRTKLEAPVPTGMDAQAWSLVVEKPNAPGLIFDDVEVYLGRNLPPYLCEKPEWLAEFLAAGHVDEQIIERVPLKTQSLSKGAAFTTTFTLAALPQAKLVALRTTAQDVDYPTEGTFTVNGQGKYQIPTTGDGATAVVTTLIKPEHLRVGENTIEFKHDDSGSSAMGLSETELIFGNAIQVE
ncbi:MAG: hypothetical protein ABFE08_01845 [Armatimonadia bacterium]